MFQQITPEQAGISSCQVSRFIRALDKRGLTMHSVLLMKGRDIFGEFYWKPFRKDLCHRMYSQTKSFVGIAVGLLEEDGLVDLDAPIHTYFPDKYQRELPPYLKEQTVRQMLVMQTAGVTPSWFRLQERDRTALYFEQNKSDHPAGMVFHYDSAGSQVLCALVERLSGKSLYDYMNERIFRHLGTFQTASILCAGTGDSWGDSALLCTTRDIASFGRFLMEGGVWDGKRLMSEDYIKAATSRQVDNNRTGFAGAFTQGYGYHIWMVPGGFAFNGMGAQLTLCLPEQDLIFACTGDNQGFPAAKDLILSAFYEYIVEEMTPAPLPEAPAEVQTMDALADSLQLTCLQGPTQSPFAKEISGRVYTCEENPMGITRFSLEFLTDDTGIFHYTNGQGEKHLPFGMGKNVFGKFPQTGYSREYGVLPGPDDFRYDCAAGAVWSEPQKLTLRVQIIDTYLGNFLTTVSFKADTAVVNMAKTAEWFLLEYNGQLVAHTNL